MTVPISEDYEATDPDVRRMLAVRHGDAAAFEDLVVRYQGRLIAVLTHLVPRHQSVEDLAQEVFLRVYRARQSYTPDAKFSTWLFKIANRVASNALRTMARRKEVHLAPSDNASSSALGLEQLALAGSGAMPVRRADKAERSEVVRQAIQSLSDRQRMAILLCKFEGMSYAEIGEAMGLSVAAIKSLLTRARVNLKAVLEPYMEHGARPQGTALESSGQKVVP